MEVRFRASVLPCGVNGPLLPTLVTETPYRVFSVHVFNDSKHFETIKGHLVSLARLGNTEWKRLPAQEVLRELNLVANPGYIHLAGNWQITTEDGELLNPSSFPFVVSLIIEASCRRLVS